MTRYKVGIISLGCDKNRVDSEIMLGNIKRNYEITNNPKEADVIIVNTCGFIEKSKQESIDTILEMASYKDNYNCKLLIATGCLTQRYGKDLIELMPEIDVLLGVNDYKKINDYIEEFISNKERIVQCNYSNDNINDGERIITTDKQVAYIRIAEGCNNHCTYCIIPKIRGKYRSRTIESIINESSELVKSGVSEIILIAQDTTRYGEDIYGKKMLVELLKEISKIEELKWIRVLYAYPEEITDDMILEFKNNHKICKYIDIPIQHVSDSILKKMGRRTNKASIETLLRKLRKEVKDIVIRTSIIVGFPSESEENFNELKEFLVEHKLDKVGVFTYSQEEDTVAATMEDQIEEDVKLYRERELMLLQQNISTEINKKKIGKIYDVLVEGFNNEHFICRSQEMAPEIDGYILIENNSNIKIGDFIKVRISESLEYDLLGVVYNESCE